MNTIKVMYATTFSIENLFEMPSDFSYYLKEISEDNRFDVCLLNPNDFKGGIFKRTLRMAKFIRTIKPDILYLTLWQGYNNLVLAKLFRLINCKIVIWDYTRCMGQNNFFLRFFFRNFFYNQIDRIYMMFENHTKSAIEKGMVNESQIITLSRGVDIKWYSQFVNENKTTEFSIIATGKDHRDYLTLGKACEETRTKCLIITAPHKKCIEVAKLFEQSEYVRFEIMENAYSLSPRRYILEQVAKASALAICCEQLPYGAGYTNIVECLAFKIPILQTKNPDVHIDPEIEGIGYNIQPYDVEGWKEKLNLIKTEKIRIDMSEKIQLMLNGEYNSKTTTEFIKNDFIRITKKYLK